MTFTDVIQQLIGKSADSAQAIGGQLSESTQKIIGSIDVPSVSQSAGVQSGGSQGDISSFFQKAYSKIEQAPNLSPHTKNIVEQLKASNPETSKAASSAFGAIGNKGLGLHNIIQKVNQNPNVSASTKAMSASLLGDKFSLSDTGEVNINNGSVWDWKPNWQRYKEDGDKNRQVLSGIFGGLGTFLTTVGEDMMADAEERAISAESSFGVTSPEQQQAKWDSLPEWAKTRLNSKDKEILLTPQLEASPITESAPFIRGVGGAGGNLLSFVGGAFSGYAEGKIVRPTADALIGIGSATPTGILLNAGFSQAGVRDVLASAMGKWADMGNYLMEAEISLPTTMGSTQKFTLNDIADVHPEIRDFMEVSWEFAPWIFGYKAIKKAGGKFTDPTTGESVLTTPEFWEGVNKEIGNFKKNVKENGSEAFLELVEKNDYKGAKLLAESSAEQIKPVESFLSGERDKAPQISIPKDLEIKGYLDKLAADQIEAGKTPTSKQLSDFYIDLKKNFIDKASPIEDFLTRTEKTYGFEVLPEYDLRAQVDRVLRTPSLAGSFARNIGLEALIKDMGTMADLQATSEFMISKYLPERAAKTEGEFAYPKNRDKATDAAIVDKYKGTKVEAAASKMYEIQNSILDYMTESGILNSEFSAMLKAEFQNYVPLNRIGEFLNIKTDAGVYPRPTIGLSKQNVVKKFSGTSEKVVQDVWVSTMDRINAAFAQGERNKAGQMLVGYKDLPGWEGLITAIEKSAEVPEGMEKLTVLFDGKAKEYAVEPWIKEVAANLSPVQFGKIATILSYPMRAFKVGTTGVEAAFLIKNPLRDAVAAFNNIVPGAEKTLLNPAIWMKSFSNSFGKGELFDKVAMEGGVPTQFDLLRNQSGKTIQSMIADSSGKSKIKHLVTSPAELWKAVETVASASEVTTRLSVFQAAEKFWIKEGMTPERARIRARQEATWSTGNFLRQGAYGQVVKLASYYLNAAVQGTRGTLRNIGRNPVSAVARFGTSMALPYTIATLWNLSSPERQAAYMEIQEYEHENSFIFLPPNPERDADGNWNSFKLPMAQPFNALLQPIRKTIEALVVEEPIKMSELMVDVLGFFSPVDISQQGFKSSAVPPLVRPELEIALNEDFFTGGEIIPSNWETRILKEEASTQIAKWLSNVGIFESPLTAEHWIEGHFGKASMTQIMNPVDHVLSLLGVIDKEDIGGTSVLDRLKTTFTTARAGRQESSLIENVLPYLDAQAKERAEIKVEASAFLDELLALKEEGKPYEDFLNDFRESSPEAFDKVEDVIKQKALNYTYEEKLIDSLGVTNWAKAEYIVNEKFQTLDDDAQQALIVDYAKREIISETTFKQIVLLMKVKKELDLEGITLDDLKDIAPED